MIKLEPAWRQLLLSLAACALVIVGWGATRYPEQRAEWNRLRLQQQSLARLNPRVTSPAVVINLQAEIDAATARLTSLRGRFPEAVDEASLIADLERAARDRRLELQAISVARPAVEPPFVTWSIELRLVGGFSELLDLLARLEAPGQVHGISWLQLRVIPDTAGVELRLRYHLRTLASTVGRGAT